MKVPRVAWGTGGITSVDELSGIGSSKAFVEEMARLGFIEGQTIIYERYATSSGRAEETARAIVASAPDVIFLLSTVTTTLEVMALTKSIPIVATSGDPLGQGIVGNLARPGGNVAAVASTGGSDSEAKVLSILAEVVPMATRLAYIGVGTGAQFNPAQQVYVRSATQAAARLGLLITTIAARDPADEQAFRDAFALATAANVQMVQFGMNTQISNNSTTLARLAPDAGLPAISPYETFAPAGGLVNYGSSSVYNARQAAGYLALVLNGAKPGDLPVLQPTVFDFVVNLKTARTLGITIPPSVLIQATEVIQ
jgi:putative ABC transport system substrate-binding protein